MDATSSPWPWPGPHVLVEDDDAARAEATADALARAGYSVAVCAGPGEGECPLVCGDGCAYVPGADVVVSRLGDDIVGALRLRHASKPLVLGAGEDVVAAVRRALAA